VGEYRDFPNLSGAPNYLGNAKSYELQIWPEHSQAHPSKSPLKILETKGAGVGVSRDCPNFLGIPYYLRNR